MLWQAVVAARDLGRLQQIAAILIRYGFGDMVRRLGSALAAADAAKAAFCEVGLSPAIGSGLRPITPVLLARLLLSEWDEAASALETISEPIEATDPD